VKGWKRGEKGERSYERSYKRSYINTKKRGSKHIVNAGNVTKNKAFNRIEGGIIPQLTTY
jgi:hypothetical protein